MGCCRRLAVESRAKAFLTKNDKYLHGCFLVYIAHFESLFKGCEKSDDRN